MHPTLKKKVGSALEAVLANPDHGKALRRELAGLRSVRIGRLRIVYRAASGIIELVAVGPRQTIYEETLRLLHRAAREGRDRG
jgi:mRNA-degrading endonuclease RelE of RelBE toxin-antitoxin system